jgi:LysR family carnitine catabolism transcriptional activator
MTNNLRYRQIKAFCYAVELGSFQKAAAQLHVTPPSFTVLIKSLEEDLGMRLFDRTTRRSEPTSGGLAFYRSVSRPLEDLEEAYKSARDEGLGVRGRLTIATTPSLASGFLSQALALFHQQSPQVRIFMSEHRSNEVLTEVTQNRVELGFGRMVFESEELTFTPLLKDQMLVAAPVDHPIHQVSRLRWKDLDGQPLILVGGGATEQQVRAAMPGMGFPIEVTHMATAIAMVRRGMGVAVTASSGLDSLNLDGIALSPLTDRSAVRILGAIRRPHRVISAAAEQFLTLASLQAQGVGSAMAAHHVP